MSTRKPYPSDVSDEEWTFVAPYLTLMSPKAPQREYPLRELFNALRWLVRAGAPWRYLPGDFPPWATVYQQTQRWIKSGCFSDIVHHLRELLRQAQGRRKQPSADWKVVAVGDYNGDGNTDLLFQNQTTNQAMIWYLKNGVFQSASNLSLTPPSGWKIVGPR